MTDSLDFGEKATPLLHWMRSNSIRQRFLFRLMLAVHFVDWFPETQMRHIHLYRHVLRFVAFEIVVESIAEKGDNTLCRLQKPIRCWDHNHKQVPENRDKHHSYTDSFGRLQKMVVRGRWALQMARDKDYSCHQAYKEDN